MPRKRSDKEFENMVAAVLAGSAVFTKNPTTDLGPDPVAKAWAVMSLQQEGTMDELMRAAPKLEPEERLFLQASAIIMLEEFFEGKIDVPDENRAKMFISTLQTFTALDQGNDEFGLRSLFEDLYRRGREQISFVSEGDALQMETGDAEGETIFQVV